MMRFIGTKIVKARPMSCAEYYIYRDWTLSSNENGNDLGYLVEYMDGGKPNHPNHVGYISWSPARQFNLAYRESGGLPFGLVLEALKLGEKIARIGWNGKGMWLSLSGNTLEPRNVAFENLWSKQNSEFARTHGGSAEILPCITMKTADDKIQMGWLASQADMLAEDWYIV